MKNQGNLDKSREREKFKQENAKRVREVKKRVQKKEEQGKNIEG